MRARRTPSLWFAVAAVAFGLVAAGGEPTSAMASAPRFAGSVGIGDALFWDGEYVSESRGGLAGVGAYFFAPPEAQAASDPCVTGSAFCRLYEFEVTEPDGTLRVALDSSRRGECVAIELRDPAGRRAPSRFDPGFPFICPEEVGPPQAFTIEQAVPHARPGTWQVRALGIEVTDWAYRMRAVLEAGSRAREPRVLRPNLIPWVPSEFGFVAPASPNPGTAIDRRNPPGAPGTSCHAEEAPDTRCLRFSAGISNVGDGPFFVAFRDDQAFQHVYYSDDTPGTYADNEATGSYRERHAGAAEFHPAHGHRHFKDMVLYELFAVADASPSPPYRQGTRLIPVGTGRKHGWCAFSQRFENWFGFAQDDQFASNAGAERYCDTSFTLERGWGDPYRWQRPGQYVPYDPVADADGTMRAGHYLVRVTVDPTDLLEETRETDNVAYAHIRIIDGATPNSDRVIVCEQGFGNSPWDPTKHMTEDPFAWAKRLQDPTDTPEPC